LKASTKALVSTQQPEVKISHGTEELSFYINVFGKKSFNHIDFDVFDFINGYWEQLPITKQDLIFKTYKDIKIAFDTIFVNKDLSEYISDKTKLLLEYHDMEDLKDWLTLKTNIIIPDSFTSEYTHSIDNNTSREKTYTKSDYVKLVTLSTLLRVMIPIWGEYINVIRKDIGNDFKEFYAFQLLNKSDILKSIPMEKLKTYIDHIVANDRTKPTNTINNISSEDYTYWLLALVCIRRLCLGDIKGNDPKTNLITLIYKSIIQRIKGVDNNTEETVRMKLSDDRGSSLEDKTSTLERYRINMDLSSEDIVELEYSIHDIRNVVNKLSHNVSNEFLFRSISTSKKLEKEILLTPQIMLLSWVLKPIISPRGLLYLNKNKIVEALGAVETLLWVRGHKYLSILVTSYAANGDNTMMISPVDSKTKIEPNLVSQLNELYPMLPSSKRNSEATNFAIQSIDAFINQLVTHTWKPTVDTSMLIEVFGTEIRKVPILPDIKNHLAKLIIEIGNRNWV